MLINGWPAVPLSSILIDSFAGSWGESPSDSQMENVRVLRATNIDTEGKIDYSAPALRVFSEKDVKRRRLVPGDLILEASGGGPGTPVGRVALFSGEVANSTYSCSNFFRVLRPNQEIVDPEYLTYALVHAYKSPSIWRYQQQTTGLVNLRVKDYLEQFVLLPSLSEQRRIVEVIGSLDAQIATTSRTVKKVQSLVAGIGSDLLNWFPGGRAADGWRRETLEEIAAGAPICYGIVQAGPSVDSGVPVVMIRDLRKGFTDLSNTSPAIESSYARSRIRPGDVLLSIKATIGRVAIVPDGVYGNISRDLARIRVSAAHDPEFIRWLLSTSPVQQLLQNSVVGTTRAELSIAMLKKLILPVPSKSMQNQIARKVSSLQAYLDSLMDEERKLSILKRGVECDLLSGRVLIDCV